MAAVKRKRLLNRAKSLMEYDELAEALSEVLEEQRGTLGFLLKTLKRRPRTFNPHVLKGLSFTGNRPRWTIKQLNLLQ